MKTKKVHIFDNQKRNLGDNLVAGDKRPRGFVEIFDKRSGERITSSDNVTFPYLEKITEDNNLIVYTGRTWLMQRSFNQDLSSGSNVSQRYISWFGLGTGGATPGDPLNEVAPESIDSDLDSPAIINLSDPDCVNDGYLHPFDIIEYETDSTNDDQYLIAKVTTTIASNDANGPAGSTHYDLSEAGLWISNSNVAGSFSAASKILFARVTYSTIRKHSEREIVFIWSIYF